MGELTGKAAIVSGATSGIGKGQALMLAKEGADIICIGRNAVRMENVVAELRALGVRALPCIGDVSVGDTSKQAAQLCINNFGKIDICCATAGVFDSFTPSIDVSEEKWDEIIRINVKGVFMLCNAVLPNMLEHENGSIITMASIAGLTGNAGGAVYTTTKHAVVSYTKQLCIDYASKGIRANAICAGSVDSNILEGIFTEFPEEREAVMLGIPAKRLGTPEDIGYLTVYLACDKSAWINGSIISADGGRSAFG